ncbi:AfsR/SARP family transcriptional regulator [Lentzea nigeriaca]|uniref:AfsR/SARP family transcriptional regulator n=1 Tax=Lentzea nigeriaca TaxID=1128665 RepID=UPI00195BF05B|nr:AfsR/SARP family transcriptional regulator [Lentzea nigeriaca]MBM7862213.1 DNA-binding SARP family transcriptional activator [Lentzea nigeriaca]
MEIKVLGPLEARENGVSITPTASKPRQLLALLALQAGHVVTVPTLIEELWGMAPPRSALTTLQTYVLQVRRKINAAMPGEDASAAKEVLVTRYGGYLLNVAPENVDVRSYERLATAGQRATETGDLESASRLLGQALEVWRGPVLVDVQVGTKLAMEVTRLQESRLGVLEARIDADLRLGRHQSMISELSMLTAQHPMHENLCAQYMLSLYRSGRQWRALEAFQALRETLIEELGLEPSMRLRQLQRAILSSDPALDTSMSVKSLERQLAG